MIISALAIQMTATESLPSLICKIDVCARELFEAKLDTSDYKIDPSVLLKKLYVCRLRGVCTHWHEVCRICNQPIYINPYAKIHAEMINHILIVHHESHVLNTVGCDYVSVSTYNNFTIHIRINNLLRLLPQFLGLRCEYSLNDVVRGLFGDLRESEVKRKNLNPCYHVYLYVDRDTEHNTDEVADALRGLNYSCIICGEEYDCMPSLEMYHSHLTVCAR